MAAGGGLILEARGLTRVFGGGRTVTGRRRPETRAVDRVSFQVHRGETLGIVGESGSGKSTLARMLVGLLTPTAGELCLEGRRPGGGRGAARRARVQLVFQDPVSALNPRKTVRAALETPLRALLSLPRARRAARIAELMELVNLDREYLDRYPHELSGGQAQRAAVARALAAEPSLLVLDEPTSALDVSVQARILGLLKRLRRELSLTCIFISHDLSVIDNMCNTVAVMHRGRIVEQSDARTLFSRPRSAYTRRLLESAAPPQALVPRLPARR